MRKLIFPSVVSLFFGIVANDAVQADTASTTGGIRIRSDDGAFEANLGSRLHFDVVSLSPDSGAFHGTASKYYGSSSLDNTSGAYLRRAFLSLSGKLYGWEYKIDEDLMGGEAGSGTSSTTTTTNSCDTTKTASTSTDIACTTGAGKPGVLSTTSTTTTTTFTPAAGFQEVYVAHSFFSGGTIYIGQHKPWRSFEEAQSNNETLFMERPITSGSGILARDYQDGVFYKYVNQDLNLWAGASGYSLSKAGQSSTEGVGGNGRVAWAPINQQGQLVHVAFSYSSDHADNGSAIAPKYTYGGYKLGTTDSFTFASYGSRTSSSVFANATANIWTGELAGIYGPAYLEAEYAHETLGADAVGATAASGSNLSAYDVQTSYFLTGESKSYRLSEAVVAGNPKPLHAYGAVELKARYEYARNGNATSGNAGKACSVTTNNALPASPAVSKCSVADWALGVNYYVNPNVRFMLDYIKARADLGNAGKDEPQTIALRTQINF